MLRLLWLIWSDMIYTISIYILIYTVLYGNNSPNSHTIWLAAVTGVFPFVYSRRFATATARTASLGSHSRGIETKNIRKYWLSEKKRRRIWWPCIAAQRSSKNNETHEKTAKLLLFTVFLRGEKQKPLQIPWFLRVRWPKTL